MPVANTICLVEKLVKYILKIEAACELLRGEIRKTYRKVNLSYSKLAKLTAYYIASYQALTNLSTALSSALSYFFQKPASS